MAMAEASLLSSSLLPSSSKPPPPFRRRRLRLRHPPPRPKPLLSDVRRDLAPSTVANHRIKYYSRLASNLAGAGRLREFLMTAEGVLAASGDAHFASRLSPRLVSHGVVAALRAHGLGHVLGFLREAERIGIRTSKLLDQPALDAVAAACRVLLQERRMVEFVENVETLAGYGFFVQGIVDPMDVLIIFVKKRDPDMAVRYASVFPHSQLLLCNTMEEFGKRKNLKHALKVFGALKQLFGGINMFACRSIIDICGHCGAYMQSRFIFEGLLAEKITPNIYVFNSLMNVNAHDLSYNFSVYKHMQNLGVPADLTSYNILLKTCCNAREFKLAQEIYGEMKNKAGNGLLKLDVFTYSTMMKVFADARMWQMASHVKEDMDAAGVQPNLVTWSSLINAYANSGLLDRAIQMLEEMLRDGCEPNAQCFNIILSACVKSCQYDRAFRLFYSWKESGIRISHSPENKGCLAKNFTLYQEHSSDKLESSFLVVPFRPTVTSYNILMKACGTNSLRAKTLMNEMRQSGLCPNHISWSILMDIYGTAQDRRSAIQALRRMERAGIKLNVFAYTTAIKACVESNDLKLAFHLFEEMKVYRLKPNLVTYKTLLRARSKYGSLHEVQQCLTIYQEMRKAGYQANDYYLKNLIVEWCEGVLCSESENRDFYHFDLKDKRKESFILLLEKVATYLQKDVDQNQIVDVRGLTKVEARIVVLSVLRKIKENYILGKAVQDDMIIITGHEKASTMDVETSATDVENAIIVVLKDDLGLEVMSGPGGHPPVSTKSAVLTLPRTRFEQDSKHLARRPQNFGVLKITVDSLNHWLERKDVKVVR